MKLIQGDCVHVVKDMPDASVDAIITDPPYNIGKDVWDKIPNYLQWCEKWISEASRVCKRQGAFWCFHSEPLVLADIARIIERHGRPMQNWVTWDKYNGNSGGVQYIMNRTKIGRPEGNKKRTFDQDAEYIVYHADDGQWTAQSDECRGFIFEPLRAYLDGERVRAGWNKSQVNKIFDGPNVGQYWWQQRNWQLPIRAHYEAMKQAFNTQGGDYLLREYDDLLREYDDLRREYEDLRREYEHLRPTFNNPGKVSSVWQYPPAKSAGHITTKPVELIQRIVESTTNEGDTVLDPFMGSGTTGVACANTGRKFIGIELELDYFEIAQKRIEVATRQLKLF